MALDDINRLRLFVAIVDAGSLSSAARALGIGLPVASRKLRQLETALGVRLLQRTTRRQALTEEGRLLHQYAVDLLADLDQMEQQLLRKSATVSGPLRMTMPVSLGRRRIAPLLAEFCALHPQLSLQIELADSVVDLVSAGMDLAIRFGGLDDSSYVSQPLAPNHRVLCASPGYLQRHGEPRSPAELAQHRCLVIGTSPQTEWRLDDTSVRIAAHMTANDGDVVHQWAVDGYGIALKSILDVGEDLASGRLRRVLGGHRLPATPLHAVYPHKRHVAPRVRACIAYLAPRLQALANVEGTEPLAHPSRVP
ncbi:LysR family transcriptional regulator [Luteimonas sp. BDR2-5]|uniref:LysR family transcriptional regulator n=1 Tax=Proluteimonas luteida TaxID=2878685 RepID=UPI001E4C616A|nr:LysR family transcriptional regulator [Luteimonas sp. BDR2-5]MCD9028372.1 LysR family transcriptional regulator [Luteimonas sp. BDR2-5]